MALEWRSKYWMDMSLICKWRPVTLYRGCKAAIEGKEGIPRDQQRLISLNVNKELEDDCTLADYNIENDSTLNLLLWMKGLSINGQLLLLHVIAVMLVVVLCLI